MDAVLAAFAVVFVAELGDKTQLVVMSLATRHRPLLVIGGITIAYAITNGVSVVVGGLLGAAIPTTAISVAGGLAFLGFAVWTIRDTDGDDDVDGVSISSRAVIASIVGTMVLAELGDKTMLATTTLAARNDPLLTWVGATTGIVASSVLAVVAGKLLGDRLPERATRIGAAVLFAVFGLLLLADAVL